MEKVNVIAKNVNAHDCTETKENGVINEMWLRKFLIIQEKKNGKIADDDLKIVPIVDKMYASCPKQDSRKKNKRKE